jgi:hypothetical protein
MLDVAYYIFSCACAVTWCVLAFYVPYKTYSNVLKSEVLRFTQILYQVTFGALVLYVIGLGMLISEWYEALIAKNVPFIIATCILLCALVFHVVVLIRIRKGVLTNVPLHIYGALVTMLLVFSLYQFEKTMFIFSLTAISIFAIWLIIRYGVHKYIKYFL